jgi:hypothetical protein
MDQNKIPHDPHYLGVLSSASKTTSELMVCHLGVPKRASTWACHLGVPSGASKQFLSLLYVWRKPCTYLALTLTPSPNGLRQDLTWPTSPRSSIGCVQNDFRSYSTFGASRAPILCQYLHYLQMDWNKLPLEPRHLGVSSGVSKMISDPIVHLAQTVHLSCLNTNTVYKLIKTRFKMTHVT